MSDLNIVQLLNDKTTEFGNERFLEGWNGAIDYIIKKLLEDIEQSNGGKWVWSCDGYPAEFNKDELIALIKGEQK